jgi:hypothetical protein
LVACLGRPCPAGAQGQPETRDRPAATLLLPNFLGDLDGDGHLDLVLSMHLRGLVALRGDGQGRFSPMGPGLDFGADGGPPPFTSRAIRLADWDGDGRLDIVALGEGPRPRGPSSAFGVMRYLGQPDGSWARRPPGPRAAPVFGAALALGDFNGDGRVDVATASATLGLRRIVHLSAPDDLTSPEIDEVRPASYVRAVAVTDVDGDGRSDLALSYLSRECGGWRTGIDLLRSGAGGAWRRVPVQAEEGRREVTSLAAGDLDGDGHVDLVGVTAAGEVRVFPGMGRDRFSRERLSLPPFGGGCRGSHVELADLDGDGRPEIVASFGQESERPGDACAREGGLAAWKVAPTPAAEASPTITAGQAGATDPRGSVSR